MNKKKEKHRKKKKKNKEKKKIKKKKKNGQYTPCLKYMVPIFVEYIKCNFEG
jgi:uncharacterized membrane-anchored protein YitT (DUF2179 family)